jgi:hypothetical protein
MQIPKKIHYCWFGKNEMPKLVLKCMESWRKYQPDYEVILWNEDNFDLTMNSYIKEAYANKKWAFVSDYARLYTLYHHGGIYLDTDMEILQNLDGFLIHSMFLGMEDSSHISMGIIGAKAGHPWVKDLLDLYSQRNFVLSDGSLDFTTIVSFINNEAYKIGFAPKSFQRVLPGDIHIFPKEYFYPMSAQGIKSKYTDKTFTIHHFAGSWLPASEKLKMQLRKFIGPQNYMKVHHWLKVYDNYRGLLK